MKPEGDSTWSNMVYQSFTDYTVNIFHSVSEKG